MKSQPNSSPAASKLLNKLVVITCCCLCSSLMLDSDTVTLPFVVMQHTLLRESIVHSTFSAATNPNFSMTPTLLKCRCHSVESIDIINL